MKSLGCQTHECDSSREAPIQAFATGFKGRRADLVLNIAGVLHLSISKRIPVPGFIADAVRLPGIMAPHEQDTLEPTTHGILLAPSLPTRSAPSSLPNHHSLPSFSLRIPVSVSCPPASAALPMTAPAAHTPTVPPKRPSTVSGRAWRST